MALRRTRVSVEGRKVTGIDGRVKIEGGFGEGERVKKRAILR